MTQNRNGLNAEIIEALLEAQEETLHEDLEGLTEQTNPSQRCAYLYLIQSWAIQAGLLAAGLNRPRATVHKYFFDAVAAIAEIFRACTNDNACTPVLLHQGVSLAVIMNRTWDVLELAGYANYSPEPYDDGAFVADEIIMGYISAFLAYACGDRNKCQQFCRRTLQLGVGRTETFVIKYVTYTRALLALTEANAKVFLSELADILDQHKREAIHGKLRKEAEGLICVNGLALTALALQSELEIPIVSPYLPMDLVGF